MFIDHAAWSSPLAPEERNVLSSAKYFAPPELQSCLGFSFYKHLVPPGPKTRAPEKQADLLVARIWGTSTQSTSSESAPTSLPGGLHLHACWLLRRWRVNACGSPGLHARAAADHSLHRRIEKHIRMDRLDSTNFIQPPAQFGRNLDLTKAQVVFELFRL